MRRQRCLNRHRADLLDESAVLSPTPDRSILALDEALTAFSQVAPREARGVELRHFGVQLCNNICGFGFDTGDLLVRCLKLCFARVQELLTFGH